MVSIFNSLHTIARHSKRYKRYFIIMNMDGYLQSFSTGLLSNTECGLYIISAIPNLTLERYILQIGMPMLETNYKQIHCKSKKIA